EEIDDRLAIIVSRGGRARLRTRARATKDVEHRVDEDAARPGLDAMGIAERRDALGAGQLRHGLLDRVVDLVPEAGVALAGAGPPQGGVSGPIGPCGTFPGGPFPA